LFEVLGEVDPCEGGELIVADTWGVVGCGASFVDESMKDDNSLVFAYYKDGAANPTFLYFGDALKEVKC
jgi:hypothetical protein